MSNQGDYQEHVGGAEVIDSHAAPPSTRGNQRRYWVAGLVAVAVLASAGVGFATGSLIGGGGAQPEDVLPDSVIMYADVDLDPAAEQKVNLVRLLGRFEDIEDEYGAEPDLRSILLDELTDGTELEDADIQEWVGDRFAAGVSWDADTGTATPVAAIAVSDQDAAIEDLRTVLDDDQVAPAEAADGYVIVTGDVTNVGDGFDMDTSEGDEGESTPSGQTAIEIATAAESNPLADSSTFTSVFDRLDEGLATFYLDGAAVAEALQMSAEDEGLDPALLDPIIGLAEAGPSAAVLRADPDAIELVGWSSAPAPSGDAPVTLVDGLPDSTLFALEFTGGSEYVSDQWAKALESASDELPADQIERELAQIEAQTGLRLPEDLETLFGDDVAFAVDGEGLFTGVPGIGVRSITDPAAGADLASRLERALATATGGFGVAAQGTDDGMVVASTEEFANQLASGEGTLGQSELLRQAVPDASNASYLVFVDFAAISGALALAQPDAVDVVDPLESFGVGVTPDDGGTSLRARLVFGDSDS